MDLPYFLYMAEAEGMDDLVSTREAHLNAIRNDMEKYIGQSVSETTVRRICENHDIDFDDLSYSEFTYITHN